MRAPHNLHSFVMLLTKWVATAALFCCVVYGRGSEFEALH